MTLNRWIAIWTAFAVLAFPALSLADHHESGEEAVGQAGGGKAPEHRSEKAAEKSNAQWDEGNEGRPEKLRGADAEDGDEGEKDEKDKKGKKEKKDKGVKQKD